MSNRDRRNPFQPAPPDPPDPQVPPEPLNIHQALADVTFAVDKIARPLLALQGHLAAAAAIEPAARNAEVRRDAALKATEEAEARLRNQQAELIEHEGRLKRSREEAKQELEALADTLRSAREVHVTSLRGLAVEMDTARFEAEQEHTADVARRRAELADIEAKASEARGFLEDARAKLA